MLRSQASMICLAYAIFLLWAITAFVPSLATSLFSSNLAVLESLSSAPPEWQQGATVSAGKRLGFRIALRQENAFAFEQKVIAMSTPDHPLYGQHMRQQEVRRMLLPSLEASGAVLQWLASEGVPATNIRDDGDWIQFQVSASEAEQILHTRFHYYSHPLEKSEIIRTTRYSVPLNLHRYIQLIQPTTRFPQIRAQYSAISHHFAMSSIKDEYNQSGTVGNSSCDDRITPSCLKDLYNFGDYHGKAVNANKIGIGGFLKEYAKFDDYAAFARKFAPSAATNNFSFVFTNGGVSSEEAQADTNSGSIEGNLDSQYAFTLGYPAQGIYYSTAGSGPLAPDLEQPDDAHNQNEPFLDFLHYMMSVPDQDLPTVLSISYGENEQSVPASYANATCSLLAQLGARGVSVLVSSGDSGVGLACQTNDGTNTTRFMPAFPASCPFVTSVGGTQNAQPETATIFSGGGFSDLFCRPPYQDNAVTAYLDTLGDQWEGLYNPEGRGFPDVAAQALNFTVLNRASYLKVGGTSSAAPVFAAIISLLNGDRMSSGKPPLGFLNPFLYKVGYRGLTDILTGGSRGCTGDRLPSGSSTPLVPFASWNATAGWDPVTGLGTPDFRRLLKLTQVAHPRRRPYQL